MIADGYDLVCGSRYMKDGKQNGGPVLKGLMSRTAGTSLHFLSRVTTHDCTNSFKLYRKSIVLEVKVVLHKKDMVREIVNERCRQL